MAEKKSLGKEFTKGLIKENPVLRLVLGTCPTLAVTTSVESALGMGAAAMIVLVCSNIVISALRKVIPSKVRIPCYIVVIASFVTIVQMLVKAFLPQIDEQLGVYLPLIVVNCIILGRAEAFAGKSPVLASALDGLGMGIGFMAALLAMGAIRELFGAGTLLGYQIIPGSIAPMIIFILPPGGFFVFGMLIACANRLAERRGKPKATLNCGSCPMADACSRVNCGAFHSCNLPNQSVPFSKKRARIFANARLHPRHRGARTAGGNCAKKISARALQFPWHLSAADHDELRRAGRGAAQHR